MNNKQGFTLGEIAITIAVVGFLAAMFLPMIKNAIPNQEQLMFKKAYYLTERSVSELTMKIIILKLTMMLTQNNTSAIL